MEDKMDLTGWFEGIYEKHKDDVNFIVEGILLNFTEEIVAVMISDGITRTELARRLGVSKAFVSKTLYGTANMTLKTMVSIAKALDCRIDIKFTPEKNRQGGRKRERKAQLSNTESASLPGKIKRRRHSRVEPDAPVAK